MIFFLKYMLFRSSRPVHRQSKTRNEYFKLARETNRSATFETTDQSYAWKRTTALPLTRVDNGIHGHLLRTAHKFCATKIEHSHWLTGHITHLWLTDKSQTNLWAFLSAVPWFYQAMLVLLMSKTSLVILPSLSLSHHLITENPLFSLDEILNCQ